MSIRHWYEEKILPRLIKRVCGDPRIEALRRHVVPLACGRVFELGVGGGANQRLYDRNLVTGFAAIDPSPALLAEAEKAAQAQGLKAEIRAGVGEAIPFADASFDTVVCTFTLCSVDDQYRTLGEMRRILKPGGRLLYLEHGRAPDPGPAICQRRIEPVWKRVAGNCHLTREVTPALRRSGFEIEWMDSCYFDRVPRWAGHVEWGVAVKNA